jgi:hypothetical protein
VTARAAAATTTRTTYLALSVRVEGARPLLATLRRRPPRGSHPHPPEACTLPSAILTGWRCSGRPDRSRSRGSS